MAARVRRMSSLLRVSSVGRFIDASDVRVLLILKRKSRGTRAPAWISVPGGDDLTGELHLIHAFGPVGQMQPRSAPMRPRASRATAMMIDAFFGCPAQLAVAAAAQEALVEFETRPSRSRSGRTIARRSLCSHANLVS
jgi:hypothetical protein